MKTRIIEATQGIDAGANWGKFLLGEFDDDDWGHVSGVSGNPRGVLNERGWTAEHFLLVDLETGEGGIFRRGGYARADLHKHQIWACPMFGPALDVIEQAADFDELPDVLELPDAAAALFGFRRAGPLAAVLEALLEAYDTYLDTDVLDPLAEAVGQARGALSTYVEYE